MKYLFSFLKNIEFHILVHFYKKEMILSQTIELPIQIGCTIEEEGFYFINN